MGHNDAFLLLESFIDVHKAIDVMNHIRRDLQKDFDR